MVPATKDILPACPPCIPAPSEEGGYGSGRPGGSRGHDEDDGDASQDTSESMDGMAEEDDCSGGRSGSAGAQSNAAGSQGSGAASQADAPSQGAAATAAAMSDGLQAGSLCSDVDFNMYDLYSSANNERMIGATGMVAGGGGGGAGGESCYALPGEASRAGIGSGLPNEPLKLSTLLLGGERRE